MAPAAQGERAGEAGRVPDEGVGFSFLAARADAFGKASQQRCVVRRAAELGGQPGGIDANQPGLDAAGDDLVGDRPARLAPQRKCGDQAGVTADWLQPVTMRLQIDVAEDDVAVSLLAQVVQCLSGGDQGAYGADAVVQQLACLLPRKPTST